MAEEIALPNVSQSAAPIPLTQLSAPKEAFAANVVGEGLTEAGTVAEHASTALADHAIQFQMIQNKQQADSAAVTTVTKLAQARSDYMANNAGMAAYTNLPDLYQKLETVRSEGGTGLNPMALADYDSATRRQLGQEQNTLATFAQGQRKQAVIGTSNAVIEQNKATAVMGIDDPATLDPAIAAIAKEVAFQALPANQGWTPEEAQYKLHTEVGAIFVDGIKQKLDGGDVVGAQALYAAHRGDMTAQQSTAVAGVLRVSEHADAIASAAQTAIDGGDWHDIRNSSAIAPLTPNAPWDKGLAAIRANPSATIGQWLGTGPVQINSGARSPSHNAAVRGAPSSEHLSNSAWDFAPPKGMSLQQTASTLAANMHAQSVPFDQIEIDNTNGHVHVGFGAKNRNEIIDQNGRQIGGGQPQAQPSVHLTPPAITPNEDPKQILADGDAYALKVAPQMFHSPSDQQAFMSAFHQRLAIRVQQVDAQQDASASRLLNALAANPNITDQASLLRAYPNASSDFALLPPTKQTSIVFGLNRNENTLTPATQLQIQELEGKKALATSGNAVPFLQTNIPGMHLPPKIAVQYMKAQADLQNKATHIQSENTLVNQGLTSVQGKAALSGLFIKPNTPEYYQFAGALHTEIAAFQANHGGAAPKSGDMDKIITQVTAKKGGWELGPFHGGEQPAFTVPPKDHDAIQAALRKAGVEPTEVDIGAVYRGKHRQ